MPTVSSACQSDTRNCLLPRSTGLLHCLRSLAVSTPSIQLIDLTVGFEGVPPQGFAQSYYTLKSVFGASQPPPAVHIHYQTVSLADIPLGDLSGEAEATEAERAIFDAWLLERWRAKDDRLDRFYQTGSFTTSKAEDVASLVLPVQLTTVRDYFSLFASLVMPTYVVYRIVCWLLQIARG